MKKLPSCTTHINDLAQPNLLRVLQTFDQHLHHMTIFQIENFLNKLFPECQTPMETRQMIKRAIKEQKMRICRKQKEARKLRKKLNLKHAEEMPKLMAKVVESFRQFVLSDDEIELSDDAKKYSETILIEICRFMKQKVPQNDSRDVAEKALMRISDRIAIWMEDFVDQSGYKEIKSTYDESNCAKEMRKNCIPIDDYYPRFGDIIKEVEEEEKDSESVSEEEEFHEISNSQSPTKSPSKISFLRASQIKLRDGECEEISAKIKKFIRRREGEETDSESLPEEEEVKEEEEVEPEEMEPEEGAETSKSPKDKSTKKSKKDATKKSTKDGAEKTKTPKTTKDGAEKTKTPKATKDGAETPKDKPGASKSTISASKSKSSIPETKKPAKKTSKPDESDKTEKPTKRVRKNQNNEKNSIDCFTVTNKDPEWIVEWVDKSGN
jgi:hypothetical protein